jgi:hypothetical protein
MGKSMKHIAGLLFVIAAVFIYILSTTSNIWAQQPGGLLKQIQGNWTLVSIYNQWPEGRKLEQFGHNPTGSMMLTPDGRFSLFFMKSGIPKFVSNNRIKGTVEENRAVVHGCLAYFGRYAVTNEKDGVVTLIVEGSTFPNWIGRNQKRLMSVSGNTLKVVTPAAGIGGTSYIVWKRAD